MLANFEEREDGHLITVLPEEDDGDRTSPKFPQAMRLWSYVTHKIRSQVIDGLRSDLRVAESESDDE